MMAISFPRVERTPCRYVLPGSRSLAALNRTPSSVLICGQVQRYANSQCVICKRVLVLTHGRLRRRRRRRLFRRTTRNPRDGHVPRTRPEIDPPTDAVCLRQNQPVVPRRRRRRRQTATTTRGSPKTTTTTTTETGRLGRKNVQLHRGPSKD